MGYFIKRQNNEKIEGIFSIEQVLQFIAQRAFDDNDLILEAKGQSSFQLKKSNEWVSISIFLKSQKQALNTSQYTATKRTDKPLTNNSQALTPLVLNRSMPQQVTVTDIDMPFTSMVSFMVKWVIASIPAIIIIFIIFAVFFTMSAGLFRGMLR